MLPVGAAPPVVAEETTADDDIVADIVEVRQPMAEAAEEDARADRRLYEAEADAAAATAPARRAVLLLEAARLVDGPPAEVLEATRRAFAADPGLPVALWPLRRLLAAGGHWQSPHELVTVKQNAASTTRCRACRSQKAMKIYPNSKFPLG